MFMMIVGKYLWDEISCFDTRMYKRNRMAQYRHVNEYAGKCFENARLYKLSDKCKIHTYRYLIFPRIHPVLDRSFSFSHLGTFPISISQNILSRPLGCGSIVDKERSQRCLHIFSWMLDPSNFLILTKNLNRPSWLNFFLKIWHNQDGYLRTSTRKDQVIT